MSCSFSNKYKQACAGGPKDITVLGFHVEHTVSSQIGTHCIDPEMQRRLTIAQSLPTVKQAKCFSQMQHREARSQKYTMEQLDAFAEVHQVVCMSDESTISDFPYVADSKLRNDAHRALQPSHQFKARHIQVLLTQKLSAVLHLRLQVSMQPHEAAAWSCAHLIGNIYALSTVQVELEKILTSIVNLYGGTQYAAVHGRVENDFGTHCHALSKGHPETAMQALVRQRTRSLGHFRTIYLAI